MRARQVVPPLRLRKPSLRFPATDWELAPWLPVTSFHRWIGLCAGTLQERQPSGSGKQVDYETRRRARQRDVQRRQLDQVWSVTPHVRPHAIGLCPGASR